MSINESNLKRAISKETSLTKKVKDKERSRAREHKRLESKTKKKNLTNTDLTAIERLRKSILKYDSEIANLYHEISKNKETIEKYQNKVNQENLRQQRAMTATITNSNINNQNYYKESQNTHDELLKLANEVKGTVKKKENVEYDVFLSHSHKDKIDYVSKLSDILTKKGLIVFEDSKVFKIGDSQTDMMNQGIRNSRFVVLFISDDFMKSKWSEYEFKGFLNRVMKDDQVKILPIWHKVNAEDVYEYNPYLVDLFALNTSQATIQEIADSIYEVVKESQN